MRKGFVGLAIMAVVLTGCGGTGPAPVTQTEGLVPVIPSPLTPRRQTIVLTGRVVYLNDKSPAADVGVRLGLAAGCAGVSDNTGTVKITLPAGATVASVLCNAPRTFTVTAPSDSQWQVSYQGGLYPAESVPLPNDVIMGRSTALGVITIVASSPAGDGDTPPPPPSFED